MLRKFLTPPSSPRLNDQNKIDHLYNINRWKVFLGIFIGYAAYYLVRKNFALAIPDLINQGYTKTELGFALSGIAISYGISKFVMGSLSDNSNAKRFIPLGLILSAGIMLFFGFSPFATSSVFIMFLLLLVNGWAQGMGWPGCGRVMVHWFSYGERGTKMAIWNVAHNIGAGLVGVIAVIGLSLTNDWKSAFYFPAILAIIIAIISYFLITDTPKAIGLPPIEEYKKSDHQTEPNKDSFKKLFFKYIINNRSLWYLAIANLFVYMIRYGVIDWAPTFLQEEKGFSKEEASWAFAIYEFAGIPGTILCGWLSDKFFKNRRSPISIIYMSLVLVALFIYWINPVGNFTIDIIALLLIGFLIYGPVMLIGVQALDFSHKNAAGTAAGLTGLFGYLGGSVIANLLIAIIVEHFSWNGGFMTLLISGFLSIIFLHLAEKNKNQNRKINF